MKKVKSNTVFIAVFITVSILSNIVSAQNYKEDMEKIRKEYKSKCHSFSMKYLYYPYDSIKKATDSIKATCVVDSEYWYYKIKSNSGQIELLRNGKYYVEVNYSDKIIIIRKNSSAKTDLWSPNKIDSLLQNPALKISYNEKVGKGEYDITFDKGSWNRMKIVFNKQSYNIDEIWLYSPAKGKILGEPYNKPSIGIFYYAYSISEPAKDEFNEGKYLQRTNDGNFKVTDSFKEYKLLDYVHKKA
jgi:hypothetical protein